MYNLLWKIFFLYIDLKKYNCDVLYSLDGVVLRKFRKVIILYQNLLTKLMHMGIILRLIILE